MHYFRDTERWCFVYYQKTLIGKTIRCKNLAIRRIFSRVDMITKAELSNSPNDSKIRLFG